MTRTSLCTALAALTAAALAAPAATGAIVDFEDPSTYTDSGATVTTTSGFAFTDSRPAGAGQMANAIVEDPIGGSVDDFRIRSGDFDGNLTLTATNGLPFDLLSYSLSNFTFNASHTHSLTVQYNFADGGAPESDVYTVGTDVAGARVNETNFVVNQTGLSSVIFINGFNIGSEPNADSRLFFIDDLDLVSTIPEPTSLALLGPLGLAALRRRLRTSTAFAPRPA